MKSFMKEFKEFAMKGNVMDLAIGMIIGSAFTAIITALVDNIFSPLLGLLIKVDFNEMTILQNAESTSRTSPTMNSTRVSGT